MITTNIEQVVAALNGMVGRMADLEPAFSIIGAQQREQIRQRIERSKVDPEGDAWSPWKPPTRAYRERKGNAGQGLLWDEGTLLGSIRAQSSNTGVVIGTDVPYAPYLQDGTEKMDARPFAGWTDDDVYHAEMAVIHYIEAPL